MRRTTKAFTLIELLIVVAIIGILAAIAIPNFMNARIRSKVARAYADMKSLEYPIMQYKADHYMFPITQFTRPMFPVRYPKSLTTPIPYIQSVPIDIFRNDALEKDQYPIIFGFWLDVTDMSYTYGRYGPYRNSDSSGYILNQVINIDFRPGGIRTFNSNDKYRSDLVHWRLESAGPDQIRWRNKNYTDIPFSEPLYDASNGIVSNGNLYLSDEGMGGGLMKYKYMMERQE